MTSIIRDEINYNLDCWAMAGNNLSLALEYIDVFSPHSINDGNRWTNFIKGNGLLIRLPFLCVPLINKITLFVLRSLFPLVLFPQVSIGRILYDREFLDSQKNAGFAFLKTFVCLSKEEKRLRYGPDSDNLVRDAFSQFYNFCRDARIQIYQLNANPRTRRRA